MADAGFKLMEIRQQRSFDMSRDRHRLRKGLIDFGLNILRRIQRCRQLRPAATAGTERGHASATILGRLLTARLAAAFLNIASPFARAATLLMDLLAALTSLAVARVHQSRCPKPLRGHRQGGEPNDAGG